ncbi:MAG: hypothetical protein JWO22_1382, partial [Frankiales bacterium]|nr:hypothetical protein [Frankiales bacterium]
AMMGLNFLFIDQSLSVVERRVTLLAP